MRLGIAHHLGWAVVVAASPDHTVVDRRRIELIEPGLPAAPIHHAGGAHRLHQTGEPLTDEALAGLVTHVRASAVRSAATALDELAATLGRRIVSMSLQRWHADFPKDIAVQRRVPYESRADSVMYREVRADAARDRGWDIELFDRQSVEAEASRILGPRAETVLFGPRARLGPPWTKDHRMALAATVVAK